MRYLMFILSSSRSPEYQLVHVSSLRTCHQILQVLNQQLMTKLVGMVGAVNWSDDLSKEIAL